MNRIYVISLFMLALFSWLPATPALATTVCATGANCVPRINTVHDVNNMDLSGDDYTSFYLVSYGTDAGVVTPSDGAAGLFVRSTSTCASAADNGGSILVDQGNPSAGQHCFYRQNISGDLRQWGLIAGSDFDATYKIHSGHPEEILDAEPTIKKAIAALSAIPPTQSGILTLHTMGVSLKIGTRLEMPPGTSLTCDTPPVKNAGGANFKQLPGSLIIAHEDGDGSPVYIDASTYGGIANTPSNDAEISNCAAILPEWYIYPSKALDFLPSGLTHPYDNFSVPVTKYSDLEATGT